jgi:hypothetical protein
MKDNPTPRNPLVIHPYGNRAMKFLSIVSIAPRDALCHRVLAVALAVLSLSWAGVSSTSAQSAPPAARNDEPLQMLIDYGQGQPKHRESRHGVVEPIGVPIGQPVTITLQFLRKRAGERIAITAVDGGVMDLQQPATISPDGSVTFAFNAGATSGLHRLMIYGGQQYEIRLYAFDPNNAPASPRH